MEFSRESCEYYRRAYALAKRILLENKKLRFPLTPISLNMIMDDSMISRKQELGILEIPTNLIVGVAEDSERRQQYTKDFLPVSPPDSDYADRWCRLYQVLLSDADFDKPISCYEYLGKFYVCDGMKRVSAAKYHSVACLRAQVIRILPLNAVSREVSLYYDFLYQYRFTKLYQLQFTQPGFYEELQTGLGLRATHRWSNSDRAYFLAHWPSIEEAFHKSYDGMLLITAADALVILMRKFSFEKITSMEPWILPRVFQALGKELYALSLSVKSAMDEESEMAVPQSA